MKKVPFNLQKAIKTPEGTKVIAEFSQETKEVDQLFYFDKCYNLKEKLCAAIDGYYYWFDDNGSAFDMDIQLYLSVEFVTKFAIIYKDLNGKYFAVEYLFDSYEEAKKETEENPSYAMFSDNEPSIVDLTIEAL